MNRQNPFSVPQAVDVPAMDATPEQMGAAMAGIAAHQSYARTRYSNLRAKFIPRSRATLVDAETAELGREMNAQREHIQAAEKSTRQLAAKARSAASRINMVLTPAQQRRPETAAAVDEVAQMMEAHKKHKAEAKS